MTSSGPATRLTKVGFPFFRRLSLFIQLTRRDIEARYRGSALGIVWSMLTPLMMLAVYTLVFGTVFKSRWAGSDVDASAAQFAVILFAGLIVFQLFSDVILRAPTIIITNANLVKRVVFPLELLLPVVFGSALFHASVSFLILLPFIYLVFGELHQTLLFLPLVLAPMATLSLGIGWFLASLGTFVRDIGQMVGTVITALLFLAPIFFPLTALPEFIRPALVFNPLTIPIEQVRQIAIFGQEPDFFALGIYSIVSGIVAVFGFTWFQKTRKGFADVL